MRVFRLHRLVDPTGISGTGIVAEGCEFSDGTCVLMWLTEHASIAFYPSREELIAIHGHGGQSVLVFVQPLLEYEEPVPLPNPVQAFQEAIQGEAPTL